MPVSKAHLEEIASLIDRGDVSGVFRILNLYEDLRSSDLPALSKEALRQLSDRSESLRELVVGLASPSLSIRRFTKKYVPKIPASADLLLYLAIESMDPIRPGPGLLGSFGEFASPIGQTMIESNLSFEFKPPQAYSPAVKFAKEALETISDALASTSLSHCILAKEFGALYQRDGVLDKNSPELSRPWDPENRKWVPYYTHWFFLEHMEQALTKQASKGDNDLFSASLLWANAKNRIASDHTAESLRSRYTGFSEEERRLSRLRLWRFAARLMLVFPKEQRIQLYDLLKEQLPKSFPESEQNAIRGFYFKPYYERFPDQDVPAQEEFIQKAQEHAKERMRKSAAAAGKEVDETELAKAAQSFVDSAAGKMTIRKELKFRVEDVLKAIHQLAEQCGFPELYQQLSQDLKTRYQSKVKQSSSPSARKEEDLLRSVRDHYLNDRNSSVEAPADSAVPTPIDEALADFFHRNCKPGHSMMSAVALLSESAQDRLGELWSKKFTGGEDWTLNYDHRTSKSMLDLMKKRGFQATGLWEHWLRYANRLPNGHQFWQMILARVYESPSSDDHDAVCRIISTIALPTGAEHYKRKDWNLPYQWLVNTATRRRDAELLAIAMERCALPFYWKGSKACLPIVETLEFDTYAPQTCSSSEGDIPVENIWNLVVEAAPARIPGIIENMFRIVEFEELPRAVLIIAATNKNSSPAFSSHETDVFGLLESSQPPVVEVGLFLIEENPALVQNHLRELLPLMERGLASSSASVAKACASLAATLAKHYPDQASALADSLSSALNYENASLLEQILKSLTKIGTTLDEKTIARCKELAAQDPRRFSKLVSKLA